MRTVSVYDAKTHLSQILTQVEAGESVVVTRNGVPVAEIVPVRRVGRSAAALQGLVAFVADDAFAPMSDAEVGELEGAPLVSAP